MSGLRRAWPHAVGGLMAVGFAAGMLFSADRSLPGLGSTAVLVVPSLIAGWVLTVRARGNLVGPALLGYAGWFVAGIDAATLGDAIRSTAPDAAKWLYWLSGDAEISWIWVPSVWTLLIWIPLHFPDGRLLSRRWRWLSVLAVTELLLAIVLFSTTVPGTHGMANPVGLEVLAQLSGPLFGLSGLLAVTCFVGSIVSIVLRYRAGSVLVRAQLRWVLWAVAIAIAVLVSSWFVPVPSYSNWVPLVYALIPIAIVVAVLRYRLYEIDRIISRTAAYALVTLVVLGTYLGVVLLASALLRQGQDGQAPPIAVAIATLAAAAVFLPVLRWVRRRIDRVFNRSQYDAERVVAAFGQHVRDGADPHAAGAELLRAVDESLVPAAVGLWVRP